jgi:methionyl aminopeptidase
MIVAGSPRFRLERDGWTARTSDSSLSAQEEHTIMVAYGRPVVLAA